MVAEPNSERKMNMDIKVSEEEIGVLSDNLPYFGIQISDSDRERLKRDLTSIFREDLCSSFVERLKRDLTSIFREDVIDGFVILGEDINISSSGLEVKVDGNGAIYKPMKLLSNRVYDFKPSLRVKIRSTLNDLMGRYPTKDLLLRLKSEGEINRIMRDMLLPNGDTNYEFSLYGELRYTVNGYRNPVLVLPKKVRAEDKEIIKDWQNDIAQIIN